MARPGSRNSTECDCSAPKARGAEGCATCLWKDGAKPRRALLISSLRNLGGEATLRAIQVEMNLHIRKCSEALADAIADGQVERIVTEAEYHKNEVVFQLVESIPVRVLAGAQTAFPRLDRWMERTERAARPPKSPAKLRPAGWTQLVAFLVAARAKRAKPKPPVVCSHVIDEQDGSTCREIVYAGRLAEHLAEKHGAEPPPVPVVPNAPLAGQLALC